MIQPNVKNEWGNLKEIIVGSAINAQVPTVGDKCLHNIDYAHFQYVIPPIKKCKYIVTIHDVLFLDFPQYFPFLYRLKNNLLFKYSAKKSDIVLTVSQYSKERIEMHFNINDVKIIPNAVDLTYFETIQEKCKSSSSSVVGILLETTL